MKLALLIALLLVGVVDSDWLWSVDPTEASDVTKMDGGEEAPPPNP